MNAGTVEEGRLDLQRRHAIAAGVHDVVGAAVMPEIAVLVESREVAAGKPVAPESVRFLLGAAPVAEHQPGLGAMDGEEADLADGQRFGQAGARND